MKNCHNCKHKRKIYIRKWNGWYPPKFGCSYFQTNYVRSVAKNSCKEWLSKDNGLDRLIKPIPEKHPKCKGYKSWTSCGYEYDCGYETDLICEDCKYGMGRKDPEAKCNQLDK